MPYNKYLDTVMQTMPAIQARQIRDLLDKFKEDGKIKNSDEYIQALRELSVLVNADVPKPSFRRILALIWHLCKSSSYNEMFTAAKNDIEAAFFQVDEMGQRLDNHHFFMLKSIISDLEKDINEQETIINRLKWIKSADNEFTNAQVNNFSSSDLLQTARSQLGAEDLYCDNRTQVKKDIVELPTAIVDLHGKKLILPTEESFNIYPISVVQISDSYSFGTDIKTDIDNNINNIIDGQAGTFWHRNVFLPGSVEKVTTILRFNFDKGTDINYMIIEGASTENFYIENVYGIMTSGSRVSLLSDPVLITGKGRVDFKKYFLKAIEATFSVYSYEKVEYFTNPDESTFNILDPEQDLNKADIFEYLDSSIKEEALIQSTFATTRPKGENIDKYVYRFGLDNVWFGCGNYKDTAIFVSQPLEMSDIGILGVSSSEEIEAGLIDNSIEYDIIKKDVYPAVTEVRVPIPKIDQSTVEHERLVFTHKIKPSNIVNDISMLRFCPYIPADYEPEDEAPVIVYKNGNRLSIGTDWKYSISTSGLDGSIFEWNVTMTQATDFANFTLMPQKMWIYITNLDSNAAYTVSYTIRSSDRSSSDTTVWLDKNRTSYIGENGRVYFIKDVEKSISSEVYLQVTLRRNSASKSTTPKLLKYSLLGAGYLR